MGALKMITLSFLNLVKIMLKITGWLKMMRKRAGKLLSRNERGVINS